MKQNNRNYDYRDEYYYSQDPTYIFIYIDISKYNIHKHNIYTPINMVYNICCFFKVASTQSTGSRDQSSMDVCQDTFDLKLSYIITLRCSAQKWGIVVINNDQTNWNMLFFVCFLKLMYSWWWDKLYIVPILYVADFLKNDTSLNSIASELKAFCIVHELFCQSKILARFERSTLQNHPEKGRWSATSSCSSQTLLQPLDPCVDPWESLEVGKKYAKLFGLLPSSVWYIIVILIFVDIYSILSW